MTDWMADLAQFLGEVTPDPIEPALQGGAELGLGVLGSAPVQTFGRVMSLPQDAVKLGTGTLIGQINRGLGALPGQPGYEPATEAAYAQGGGRAAWEQVRSEEPMWFQLPTEIGIDPLTWAGLAGKGATSLSEAGRVARASGHPYLAAAEEAYGYGLRGIQAYNDAPGKLLHNNLRLPQAIGGGEASIQGLARGMKSAIGTVAPKAFQESERSVRMNLSDDLLDIADAKSRPLDGSVIGTAEYQVPVPQPTYGRGRAPDPRVEAQLRSRLDDLGLSDVGLKLVRDLRDISPTAGEGDMALYRSREKLVAIAVNSARDSDLPRLVDHEAIHALTDLGLWQGDEYGVLVRTAEQMGLGAHVDSLYPELLGNAARREDEMVAALYSRYRAGVPIPDPARSLFQRMVEFFKRFGGVAQETTPKDVLRRIDTGVIGGRARSSAAPVSTTLPSDPGAFADFFARRHPNPAAEQVRQNIEASGTSLKDRDPTFFDRFRAMVDDKDPEQVIQMMQQPVTRPGTPSLRQINPNWEQESWDRLQRAIAWASRPKEEGGYGAKAVQTALNKKPKGAGGKTVGELLAPPTPEIYDKMMQMPVGHLLWYDLSGKAIDEIDGMTPEQARKFVELIAATSPGETPYTNLKLATAVMSEDMRNRPAWVGMRSTSQVERVLQGVGLGGPKTDNFALEIGLRSKALRDPNKGATPVIDLWQSRVYHLPDGQEVGGSDPLFAIIAHHTVDETDALNQAMGPYLNDVAGAPLTLEPRMTQAGPWVLGRANEGLYDKGDLVVPPFDEATDYWSAMRKMERGLATDHPGLLGDSGRISVRDLVHPELADALTYNGVTNYEEGRHILTEFANSNTVAGVRAQEILLNAEKLPPENPVRNQILNGFTPRKGELADGAPKTVPGIYQLQRRIFEDTAESKDLTEMAAALMQIPKGKLEVGRINTRAYGSWEGKLSPHLDIPTMGRVNGKLVVFPQEVVERMMMGIAQAWRQDGAAINAWSTIDIDPALANSRIIYLPGIHLEEEMAGGIKALPKELDRIAQVTRASGWPTQVVSSPRMTMIKLIDTGDPDMPRLSDDALRQALTDAGFSGEASVVPAIHTSSFIGADPEIGYAAAISNPGRAKARGDLSERVIFGEDRTYPHVPIGGRVPQSDWGGKSRERFRAVTDRLRARFDETTAELDTALTWHERRLAAEFGANDLPWVVDPALAARRSELEATGGVAQNFPMGEDAFARVAAKALGTDPSDPAAHIFADLDPRLSEAQNGLLRGNTLKDGRTWGEVLETEAAKIRDDLQKFADSGVTWGPRATPQERLDAAAGQPEIGKIIKRFNDQGIDLMAASADNPYKLATFKLTEIIDKDAGRTFHRRSNYDLFRAMWSEQALFSPKYHTGNLFGGMIQNAIAGVYQGPLKTTQEILHSFKVLRGGVDAVTAQEARESMLSYQVAAKYGFTPPSSIMRGGLASLGGEVELAGSSAIGEGVARLTRNEALGRRIGAPFAASNRLGEAINVAVREPVWIDTFTDEMDRRLPEWEGLVRERLRAAGAANADSFTADMLPDLEPGLLRGHLEQMGLDAGVAEHLSRKFVETRTAANKLALEQLDRIQFYGKRTNLDEWVGKVAPFTYWYSRALRSYGEAAINNPALGLAYLRAADGIEDASNDPGLSARQQGFLRLMGTAMGFSLLMNPDALFGVVKVFGLQDNYEPDGETELGGALNWMKARGLGLYPWIDGTLNLMGIYGNTFEPDLLGIRHKALVGAAAQFARAELGWDPAASPYMDAMGQARYQVSSFVADILPWLTQPVTPRVGNSSQEASLDTLIESVLIAQNPNLTNGELLTLMSDTQSPEYQAAYRSVAEAGLVQQLLNFTLPVQFKVKHDATDVRRAQIDVISEEAKARGVMPWELAPTPEDLDFAARYQAMTGKPWDPGDYERAKREQDLARAPEEAKPFLLQEWAYQDLGTDEQRKHFEKYQALLDGTDPSTAGRSEAARRELAYQYLDRNRGAGAAIDDLRQLKSAFQQSYPEFAEFKGWQGRMYQLREQLGGSLAEYRRQASNQNPNAKRYFDYLEQRVMAEEPQENWQAALDQGTASAAAWQAITGMGTARSAPGPVPGFPRADITLPNLVAPEAPAQGGQLPDYLYGYQQSGMRSGAGVW